MCAEVTSNHTALVLADAILRSAVDLAYVIDRKGQLVAGNERFWLEFSVTGAPSPLQPLAGMIAEDERAMAERIWETVQRHRRAERSVRHMRTTGGQMHTFSVVETPVVHANEVTGVLGVARDVSEEATIEDKLWNQQEHREAALEYAVRASMGLVKGYVYSLRKLENMPEDKRSRFSQVIADEIDTMGRSIDNLLFSRGSADLHADEEVFDLRHVVHEVLSNCRAESVRREIRLEFDDPNVEVNYHGHEEAVARVIANLVDFCLLRLTHMGTVTVSISDCVEYIDIGIVDKGAPVNREQLDGLLSPARTPVKADGVAFSGTFDLEVARLLCDSMGGGLDLRVSDDHSIQFTIMLPRSINYLHRGTVQSHSAVE